MVIEFNEKFREALEAIENGCGNLFITGKAGTGKSTLLRHFTSTSKKKTVVLAPTGVAALNAGGQTIHSFFGFKPGVTPDSVRRLKSKELYKNLDMIVIDEISMVRADLMDCVETYMRYNGPKPGLPFGGVRMVFFGDMMQLPPVVKNDEHEIFTQLYKSPYFFDANCFGEVRPETIEFEKVYRQKDSKFLSLLNSVRNNVVTPDQLDQLNRRVIPNHTPSDGEVVLCSVNKTADIINSEKLDELPGNGLDFHAEVTGNFDLKHTPTDVDLVLKKGAQVMFVANDQQGRWVNGTLGKIIGINTTGLRPKISVSLESGEVVDVGRMSWEMIKYEWNKKSEKIVTETVGSFAQIPLQLAWAVTIHKAQGKTFERVTIDLGRRMFAHGQLYVALSRCTTLDGLTLLRPIRTTDIIVDSKITKYLVYEKTRKLATISPADLELEIRRAIRANRKIKIGYVNIKGEPSERIIAPTKLGLIDFKGSQFLGVTGWDSMREEVRTFRFDRITSCEIAD
jgi:energy-coupling factor transporter ATP-binding protein EcfA2